MQQAHDSQPSGGSIPDLPGPVATSGMDHERPADLKVVHSADLLGEGRAVAIEHNGATYRLQTTKLGKLILTK